jgi:hypothetical protein
VQQRIFLFIYRDFAKIYGPSQIFQKYTSAAVARGVRDITRGHGGRSRQEWAQTLNAAGHSLTPGVSMALS